MAKQIDIPAVITVGALADKLDLPVTKLISELMKNGVMATVNEQIDYDTAAIITSELDLDVTLEKQTDEGQHQPRKKSTTSSGQSRPPVVAVMGHVDHGKTTLLDRIRGSSITSGEAGGITQHISAYQVNHNNRQITFLDTPGHEAFAAIRNHAASLTDLAILVVAADDGVKPQTLEAIRFATNAGVKILVAINKIDRPEADTNRVKQELSEHKLLAEEWGGDTVILEVSAKTGQGVDELLDMILLMADVEDLRAESSGPASGLVIESHLEKGRGPVANALVESGTLRAGEYITSGETYAKIRELLSSDGKTIESAGPSMPVIITGFKALPEFGDEFQALASEKLVKAAAEAEAMRRHSSSSRQGIASSELISLINRKNRLSELNVLVKADVQGSLTSVIDSLKSLNTEEVATNVVGASVGNVTENDLALAKSSGAIIYGFNVDITSSVRRLATRDKISIRLYRVIYELIDDAKSELSLLLTPEITEVELGRLNVKAIFKTTRSETICGGEVTKGKLLAPALARVTRNGEVLAEVNVTNLKRGPQDTKEVLEGEMCGVSLATKTRLSLAEGDRLEVFERKTSDRHL